MTTTRVPSPSPYAPTIGFSAAVRAGDWVHVSGTTAVNGEGEIVGGDDPAAQTREVVRKLAAALDAVGAGLEDVVRTRMYLVDPGDWEAVGARPRRGVRGREARRDDARQRPARPADAGRARGRRLRAGVTGHGFVVESVNVSVRL